MRLSLLFLVGLLLLLPDINQAQQAQTPAAPTTRYTATIIPAENPAGPRTYGYDIRANGKLLIHQPSVPGVAGNRGFATATRARKAAAVVLAKLSRGQMPPTVTPAELKTAGAL